MIFCYDVLALDLITKIFDNILVIHLHVNCLEMQHSYILNQVFVLVSKEGMIIWQQSYDYSYCDLMNPCTQYFTDIWLWLKNHNDLDKNAQNHIITISII